MSDLPNKFQPPKDLKKPRIPDHEVMRCIGRGSYGEVWLAKAVTSSMRAVKVVRREDFESARTFEREFEGILKIEPISRNHPGLVDILHVGRNEAEEFYYYVMELADDRDRGQRIQPIDYEPRTLSSDRASKLRFGVEETISVGVALAAGLYHLHERGLTHRDIKPSNIIFVDGVPKLADIGLVAETGQRTYVGTEGFVPPEGPGTASSDIYSLGMVLYELSTGLDRLKFPELPNDPGMDSADRKRRRMLNELICRACHPMANKRFPTARHLMDALRRVRNGKYNRPILPRAAAFFAVSSVLGFSLAWARTGVPPWPPGMRGTNLVNPADVERMEKLRQEVVVLPVGTGRLSITTIPPGADVTMDGNLLGFTDKEFVDLPTGKHSFVVKHKRNVYKSETFSVNIQPGENHPQSFKLNFRQPEFGKDWTNSNDMVFSPVGDHHESAPVKVEDYERLTTYTAEDRVGGKAWVKRAYAEVFCQRLLEADVAAAKLLDKMKYSYEPKILEERAGDPSSAASGDLTAAEMAEDRLISFRCKLIRKQFGDVLITSKPSKATVSINGNPVGETPLPLTELPVGKVKIVLSLTGYDDFKVEDFAIESAKQKKLNATLVESRKAVLGKPYTNFTGMKFRPIDGTQLLFSIWETRKLEYDLFLQSTTLQTYTDNKNPTPEHPVSVIREDAVAFCRWLTMRDRQEGLLPEDLEYRLPTDLEWSLAANLHERPMPDPSRRNQVYKNFYVWGKSETAWPPPREKGDKPGCMPGNFSDFSRRGNDRDAKNDVIIGLAKESRYPDGKPYNDGFAWTAPVGRFAPNEYGLYDLCGNVSEWVSDNYGGKDSDLASYGVVRGGNWSDSSKEDLLASNRNAIPADLLLFDASRKDVPANLLNETLYGFRCVIATAPMPPAARVVKDD